MALRLRRQDAREESPPPAERGVPYKLASYEHDMEGKRFKSSDVVYSFWSAAKYTLILSIVLWWLPLFGQMIAGYVGGRRAGGPWKGVAASILPVVCLYIVVTGFDSGFFPSHVMGVAIAPAAVAASVGDSLPLISPYIQFSSEYVGSFVDALAGSSPYGINTYIVTVAFAYVGGILAEQSRREIEYTSGAVMNNTTVLMADHPQRLHPYPAPARQGLAHMIASHMPWSHEYGGPSHQHVHALPPARGGWQYAGNASMGNVVPGRQGAIDASAEARERPARRAASPRRKKGSRGKQDPWQRAERRVRQPYSAARRFAPEYGGDIQVPAGGRKRKRHPTASGRQRAPARGFEPADTRSVKRARKKIDREWSGHYRVQRPPERPTEFFEDDECFDEDAVSRAHRSARRSTPKSKRWDTI